jgi:hypothetical protein
MYDNLDFKMRNTDVPDTDFLSETTCYFDITGEHDFNGEHVISGTLGKVSGNNYFHITATRNGVNIKNGSLCKWYLGNNFQTLGRGDIQRAIEKLSDTLHLPLEKATVSRLDIAQNFIVKNPVQVYYNHLGELKHCRRSPVTDGEGDTEGLYYFQKNGNGLSLFYNKLKEQKNKGQPIPESYQDQNILRYEQRYKSRLSKVFNVERVTAAMLYDEKFYIDVCNRWRDNYKAIEKINDITLNFEAMKGKKDLYTMGLLSLVEIQGGELATITQINEALKSGKITKKMAFDMRQAIKEACKCKEGITVKNEAILELDRKVNEAIKFYR